ncbi:MAG: hypothetical protein V4726_19850 [Verrucomicrobiota bacterium]
MIFTVLLFILTGFSLILQDFIPVFDWAYHSRILIVPVVFFACAVSVPYPVMLMLAFSTGFVWDARNLINPDYAEKLAPGLLTGNLHFGDIGQAAFQLETAVPHSGASFGFTIFLYGLLGSLMQGIRPLFRRGRWELPVLMTGVGTFLLLLLDYLWINFRRGGFVFPVEVWYYLLTTALLSMFVAPLVFFLIDCLAKLSGYRIRYTGLTNRRWAPPS